MLELELSGTPREMGLAHGKYFKKQIQTFCAVRRELLMDYFKPNALIDMEDLITAQAKRLNTVPSYQEELQAIAQGAEVCLNDLIVLNNYTDLIDFSWQQKKRRSRRVQYFFFTG